MNTAASIAPQGSLDELGRLVHEGDLAAQLALSFRNLEDVLERIDRRAAELVRLRVRTSDVTGLHEVYDVLLDRLAELDSRPAIETEEVGAGELAVPGLLVTIEAVLDEAEPELPPYERVTHPSRHHPTEGNVMTMPTVDHSAGTVPGSDLRGLCAGRLHLPGDAGYDAARTPWNLAVDLRPAAVAVPHTAEEVAEVVNAAAAAGLRIAPLSTGHGAAALGESDLSRVVLVRLSELTGVSVDPDARTARVLGGTLWRDVTDAASTHGLAALHGSAPDVAVAGYTLGGGLSFYGRQHGLAAHSVVAAEIVTAEGVLVRADATQHRDLLWAVRGGGGNLGIVVALEIELLPIPDVYAGMLLWDRERAPEVVRAWTQWTRQVPESVTTSLRIMSFPPLPELPPFLSGRQLVVIDGAVLEHDDRAAELLATLRALEPEMDTFGRIPASGMLDVHMDPPAPTPGVGAHAMLGPLDEQALTALLAQVGPGTQSPLLFAELRHLGGALGRPGDGALSRLHGDYALYCVAVAPFPEAVAEGLAAGRALVAAMSPWATGHHFLNFTEQQVDASTVYDAESFTRLRGIRHAVDPDGRFLSNVEVR